ncbi:glycosyl hydrolase [Elsinoe ampelina]|uniref:Glycosyl hydrolase n=1 Tax=Elsinoe ampelina TaxID=302913 RepID=A0A6A6G5X3_9PEZI|nr:glycosyl hydrolase [Elsinoe ampelina]
MSDGPIVSHVYTADPSAHVFKGKLYVYPSHDIDAGIEDNDNGDQYAMNDYHVFSMDQVGGPVKDHGVVLSQKDIPWVSKQLWAPDAAEKNGKYYLYFPARDKDGIFRIGVAEGTDPAGPFKPDPDYIKGSYSIDPASFVDEDGSAYLYMGGIWGGQLQCWQEKGKFDEKWSGPQEPKGEGVYALSPIVAKLSDDMHSLVEEPKEVDILAPETGKKILADDHDRRFFEAAWLHKYKGKYYFSYSTGDTHYLAYATGTSPYGPFTYEGRILEPVEGWTTHHSIVEYQGRWFLFHHDSSLSGGKNHLRSVKIKEIFYDEQGKIKPVPTS